MDGPREDLPSAHKRKLIVYGAIVFLSSAIVMVLEIAAGLKPSARGELEITDLNRRYLEQARLRAQQMGRGTAWFDAGTVEDLLEAAEFIHAIQRRQATHQHEIQAPETGGVLDRDHVAG